MWKHFVSFFYSCDRYYFKTFSIYAAASLDWEWEEAYTVLDRSAGPLSIVLKRYFENKWIDFALNWFTGADKGMKRLTLGSGGQRSRSHEAEDRFVGLGEASFSIRLVE